MLLIAHSHYHMQSKTRVKKREKRDVINNLWVKKDGYESVFIINSPFDWKKKFKISETILSPNFQTFNELNFLEWQMLQLHYLLGIKLQPSAYITVSNVYPSHCNHLSIILIIHFIYVKIIDKIHSLNMTFRETFNVFKINFFLTI